MLLIIIVPVQVIDHDDPSYAKKTVWQDDLCPNWFARHRDWYEELVDVRSLPLLKCGRDNLPGIYLQ